MHSTADFVAASQAVKVLERQYDQQPCQRCGKPVWTIVDLIAPAPCDYGVLAVGGPVHNGCALLMPTRSNTYPVDVITWANSTELF